MIDFFGNTVSSRRDRHVRRPFNVKETLILSNRQAYYYALFVRSFWLLPFFACRKKAHTKLLLPLSVSSSLLCVRSRSSHFTNTLKHWSNGATFKKFGNILQFINLFGGTNERQKEEFALTATTITAKYSKQKKITRNERIQIKTSGC